MLISRALACDGLQPAITFGSQEEAVTEQSAIERTYLRLLALHTELWGREPATARRLENAISLFHDLWPAETNAVAERLRSRSSEHSMR